MDNLDYIKGSLTDFVDALQAGVRYTFVRTEAVTSTGLTDSAFEASLWRLKKRMRVAIPRKGFYVVVPLEYREAGCPPASWFIHDLMQFLGQPYYVGLLSAAAIHGAAHQQPMVLQVITDRATRPLRAGRVKVQFHKSRTVERIPVMEAQTETGFMRVATPEATALDLVHFMEASGQISNVATVLAELSERMDASVLVGVADAYALPDVQRCGYLLEHLGRYDLTNTLHQRLKKYRYRRVALVPGKGTELAATDARWRIILNERVEADL